MYRVVLMSFTAIFWTMPATADQIDGEWCSDDGQTLTINGPKIVIPSGKNIEGNYARHGFTYTGPEGDPEMGQKNPHGPTVRRTNVFVSQHKS